MADEEKTVTPAPENEEAAAEPETAAPDSEAAALEPEASGLDTGTAEEQAPVEAEEAPTKAPIQPEVTPEEPTVVAQAPEETQQKPDEPSEDQPAEAAEQKDAGETTAEEPKPASPAEETPSDDQQTVEGSKPHSDTPAAQESQQEEATTQPETEPDNAKQEVQENSTPGTPTVDQEAKPPTPEEKEQALSASKPATPQAAAESKPATPQDAESKPATPQDAGSKPATPQDAGSKPATPQAAGSKPATPQAAGSKPATPQNTGSKPATPQNAGSKPATPAQVPQGSRPSTQGTLQQQSSSDLPPPPPPIGPAAAAAANERAEEKISSSALNVSWSFGMNKNVPVLNLTDDLRRSIMYACANAGVIYDFVNNTQILLQGHSNDIKCTCTSFDKRWVATADVGPDNMIIVWDSYTGVPVRTIFEPYPDSGIRSIAMTPDAKYLATLSAADEQTLAIWDWTVEGEEPVCSVKLNPDYGTQGYVLFNQEDCYQLVTNSDTQVIFYNWESGKLTIQAPPLTDDDFNKPVGRFSQSIFQAGTSRALTATSIGNLVVWDTVRPKFQKDFAASSHEKKALKLVKLQERGINVLTTTDEFIVAGDVLGHVKFFDQTLKLMNWYQDLNLGPVNAISFAHWPEFTSDVLQGASYPKDATIRARQFVIRDFVIGTTPAVYAHITTDGTNIEIIHRDHDAAVHGLAAHPHRPHIAVGSYSGLLKIWDYEKKEALVSRWFEKGLMIRCCAYGPKGTQLAIGFTNGQLRVVDALTLNDVLSEPFRYARDSITHVAFSHDLKYLATADAEYTVSLYKAQRTGEPWIYLGRNRAHYKLIQDLLFGVHLDSNAPRLLSLGEDRVLVEYDLENSGPDDLRVSGSDRIEQSATPQCMVWYPPVTAEFFILTANDQYKFKLYNATTKMCRKTLLGPTYGSPIQKIVILPSADEINDQRYLAYVTSDKIGIHKLPLDGNPHNAMALIAHPQGVANLVSSYDGKHLFTAGGSDCTVHMWAINMQALEIQSDLGGKGLVPFYGLLEGGRDGELYKELEDYFYYAQIRSQGVETTETRRVSTHIPLSEIPFVMRAMGFYPSEQEIEDMLNEVRYSRYVETGQYMTEVELGDFIKLYINHRPAFGLQPDKIEWAFRTLGFDSPEGPALDRGDLLDILQTKGEHMTEAELADYLVTLLGYNEEGGSSQYGRLDPETAGDIIEDNLPQDITAEMFANELLGFSMYADVLQSEQGLQENGIPQASQMAT